MSPAPFCVCGQQPSFLPSLLPSFGLSFLVGKGAREERRGEGVRVTACRQRLLLPLSLPPSLPHCPFLPFWDEDGIGWGTNVIHSPARGRRSRSLRPNGQLCKSPMPPPEEVYIHLCRHRHGRFVFFFVFFTASTFLGDLRVRERGCLSLSLRFANLAKSQSVLILPPRRIRSHRGKEQEKP